MLFKFHWVEKTKVQRLKGQRFSIRRASHWKGWLQKRCLSLRRKKISPNPCLGSLALYSCLSESGLVEMEETYTGQLRAASIINYLTVMLRCLSLNKDILITEVLRRCWNLTSRPQQWMYCESNNSLEGEGEKRNRNEGSWFVNISLSEWHFFKLWNWAKFYGFCLPS